MAETIHQPISLVNDFFGGNLTGWRKIICAAEQTFKELGTNSGGVGGDSGNLEDEKFARSFDS